MKKNNILLTVLIVVFLGSCVTYKPQYAKDEAQDNLDYPQTKKLEKRFILVGDAGKSPANGLSDGLHAVQKYIDSLPETQDDYTIFLGDNIYPAGMPPEGSEARKQSEHAIDAQAEAVENFKGKVLFIPGNHEWYQKGVSGVKDEADYVIKRLKDRDSVWAPEPGTGLQIRELSDQISMIIIDSQWFLENWDKDPLINDESSEIKTRGAMLRAVENQLKKDQDKTVLMVLHHPIYTNGIHGGKYTFNRHLYPSQKSIPLPILGSLAMLIRTSGGVSIQDLQNQRYKSMAVQLSDLTRNYDRVIFTSGHEHTMQYIEHENVKQIVSGAGSKSSYAALRNDGLFAYPGQGFAVLDVFKDGSSWVSYYGSIDKKPKLQYQKEVFEKTKTYDLSDLPTDESFEASTQASVFERKDSDKSYVYQSIWGDHYRDLYGTKITIPVALLDTLYGGLEIMRKNMGGLTKSLRVKDKSGREYTIRALKKNTLALIQRGNLEGENVKSRVRNTVAKDVQNDFSSATHPYAFLAIPTLSEAVGVYHTNPKVFYLPKQRALGKYNNNYGDELYMIEERPEKNWRGQKFFGNPNHDIVSTEGMFKRLRRDEKYSLDESAYIKNRIFDMLIGDWDRGNEQWRWSETEDTDGNHVFRPIPRDRDEAFSNYDGAFFATLKGLTGFGKQLGMYGPNISDIGWFNTEAKGLDRALIQNKGKEEWMKQAEFIQQNITDEIIEEAFENLPEEVKGETTQDLIEKLKARRDNILKITQNYYSYLAKLAIVTGTDKEDFLDVLRMPEGETNIKIWRNKKGERGELVSDKTYKNGETNEIWLYGLNDDDTFSISGDGDHYIFMRVIGGQNNDIYKVENPKRLKIYDYKSKPNTFDEAGKAKIRLSDKYERNVFDKDKRIYNSNVISPAFGYNPDDGMILHLEDVFTHNGFKRHPFTRQHQFQADYHFATDGLKLEYKGQFADIFGNFNLAIGAHFTSPNFSRNFFGYGNETSNLEESSDASYDFNRVKLSRIGFDAGFVRKSPYGSYFEYKATFESVEIGYSDERFITDFAPSNNEFYDRKYFAGLEGTYRYESYDDVLNPTLGMNFNVTLGGKANLHDSNRIFGYLKPSIEFFNSISKNRKLVLHTNIQSQFNFGNNFEFYQAANLGGETGLRGYRNERFSGKTAFATGMDLRYSLAKVQTTFLPFQIGVFAGGDVGRVRLPGGESHKWHNDYGGGLWINSAQAVNGTFNLFNGDDGLRFSFGLDLQF